jgi:hypothetical protein
MWLVMAGGSFTSYNGVSLTNKLRMVQLILDLQFRTAANNQNLLPLIGTKKIDVVVTTLLLEL